MSENPGRGEGSSPARVGEAARQLIRRTRQVTRRKFPAEEKIRIVLEGIRGEVAVSELCRREGIHPTIYHKWLKDFMEALLIFLTAESAFILMAIKEYLEDLLGFGDLDLIHGRLQGPVQP